MNKLEPELDPQRYAVEAIHQNTGDCYITALL